jgi:tetratricopeptide (TPR) repeat protein
MRRAALAALAFLPSALAAQPGPPPAGSLPRSPDGRSFPDRVFYLAQQIRAMDEKVSLLVEAGKPDVAITVAGKAEAVDVPPDHPAYDLKIHLLARAAQIYADTGHRKEALEVLSKVGADVPKGGPAEAAFLLDAGRVYRRLNMPEEALKAFDRVIELSEELSRMGRRYDPGPRARSGSPSGPPNP